MSRMRLLAAALVAALSSVVLVAAPAQAAEVTLSGVVRNTDGTPVVGAYVRVRERESTLSYVGITQSDGSYAVPRPAADTVSLQIDPPFGQMAGRVSLSEFFDLSSSRVENVSLPVDAVLQAHVVAGEGGPPAVNARVTANNPLAVTTTSGGVQIGSSVPTPVCTTSAQGSCDLSVLAGGSVESLVVKPSTGYSQTFAGVDTPAGTSIATLVIAADYPVSGTLYGPDGPLTGASVSLRVDDRPPVVTTTAADGSYLLRGVPGSARLRISGGVQHIGFDAPYVFDTGYFDLDRPRTVNLGLPTVVTQEVLVTDALDQPVRDARVTMTTPSAVSGETEDGIPVTVSLYPYGGPQPTCPRTSSAGICDFPVFAGGGGVGLVVEPPFGSERYFPPQPAQPGAPPRQVVARLKGYATLQSAGSAAGQVVVTTSNDVQFLAMSPYDAPPDVDEVVGRIDFRVRVSDPGSTASVSLRLPADASANALMRVGTDGRLVEVGEIDPLALPRATVFVKDGSAADADGTVNGIVVGNVLPVDRAPLAVVTDDLPGAAKGKPYSTRLLVTGAGAPFQWSLVDGSLPGGLTLSEDGTLSGTPTTIEATRAEFAVRNAYGKTARRILTVEVNAIAVTTTSVPDGHLGGAYSFALKSTGGGLVFWSLYSGSLPPGIKLSSGGTLSGTATTAGTYTFQVRVSLNGQHSKPQTLSLQARPMEVATAALPNAPIGASYSQKLTANGGKGTLTWSLANGSLPPGLTLSSSGTLSGRPTTVGTYTVVVHVGDSSTPKQSATRTFTIVVTPMAVATTSLANAKKGQYYSAQLLASGGRPTLAWSVAGGSLPTGLTLSSGGKITGYPKAIGTWTFTVRVLDASSPKNEATATLTLTIV